MLFNLIPHSPDGFYKARLSGRLAELFTESADVRHDRIVVIEKLFAPDGLEELFRGDDPALVLAEIPEYRKLDGRELHGLAIERALVRLPVYDKAANIALLLKRPGRRGVSLIVARVAPQLGLYPLTRLS